MSIFQADAALAHVLARIGLGVNIAMHGWTRIPKFSAFEAYLQKEFLETPLPHSWITASAYVIVAAESVIGLLLLLGLFQRLALVAGSALMIVLLFGVCLVWNWNVAGSQMVYLAFFVMLLATVSHDRWSLDAWRRRSALKQASASLSV